MTDLPSTEPPPSSAQDIFRLFSTDPLQHTEEDITKIVAEMRRNRSTFASTGKAPAMKASAAAPKKPAKTTLAASLKLDLDLGDL